MKKVYKEYSDVHNNIRLKLPSNIADECKLLGIPPTEIARHYNRYKAWNIPANYEHAAIRAIEEREMIIRRKKEKGLFF